MKRIDIGTKRLALAGLDSGGPGRLVLLLHGFPDDPGSLVPLAQRFGEAGYRAVVPWLPGYPPSQAPADGDYGLPALAGGVGELIQALGSASALVVGHDWGAAIGYALASLLPERVNALVALSAPPLAAWLAVGRRYPARSWRSWYMLLFQVPRIERLVRARDLAFVAWLWRHWSPGWVAPEARLDAVRATLGAPGALVQALAYYRALPRLLRPRDRPARHLVRALLAPIQTPSLVMTGERDGCVPAALYDRLDVAFSTPPRFCRLAGAGHWLPLERTEAVAAATLDFWGSLGLGAGD